MVPLQLRFRCTLGTQISVFACVLSCVAIVSAVFVVPSMRLQALSRARKNTKKIEMPEDLEGFEFLTDEQQQVLKKCMKGDVLRRPVTLSLVAPTPGSLLTLLARR